MNRRLLRLVFAPFAFGTSAFVFVGLIDPIASDLGLGMPLGSDCGDAFGWRAAFWFAGGNSALAFALGAPRGIVLPGPGESSFKAALGG